jgi:hypothetical protein
MIGHKFHALAEALNGVRWDKSGDSFKAICPSAHSTRSQSLHVRAVDDRILIHCHKLCGAASVLDALGLDFAALYPDRPADHRIRRAPPIPYREALIGIDHEAAVVAICAGRLEQGTALTTADLDRLVLAAERIDAARRIAGARI